LPAEQRRLIRAIVLGGRAQKPKVADAMGPINSTINRRKAGDSECSSHELRDRNEFQNLSA